MNIKIISKSTIQKMIDKEIRKSSTELLEVIDRLRERIAKLEARRLK